MNRTLREHYTFKPQINTWVPKRAFKNPEEVKEKTGFDLNKCKLYTCSICKAIHMGSYSYRPKSGKRVIF